MGFESECVVVKFDDKEKYAALICGGKKDDCEKKAAYFRGLFHDVKHVSFGVFKESVYNFCENEERKGGRSVYETLPYTG